MNRQILITPEETAFIEKVQVLSIETLYPLSPEAHWLAPGVIQDQEAHLFYFDPKRWRYSKLASVSTGINRCLNVNSTCEVGILDTSDAEEAKTVLIPVNIWLKQPQKVVKPGGIIG